MEVAFSFDWRFAGLRRLTAVLLLISPALLPTPAVARGVDGTWFGDQAPRSPDFFGSVGLRVSKTPLDAKWARVRGAGIAVAGPDLAALLARLKGRSRLDKLSMVNSWVNQRITYAGDAAVHGRADVWAEANSTLASGRGDCEDIAILKLQLLVAAGFDARSLYFSIVRDRTLRKDHALLVAVENGAPLVMDNRTDRLLDANSASLFDPVFTFGVGGPWVHGYRIGQEMARVAADRATAGTP